MLAMCMCEFLCVVCYVCNVYKCGMLIIIPSAPLPYPDNTVCVRVCEKRRKERKRVGVVE